MTATGHTPKRVSTDDVDRAIAAIAARDEQRGTAARHIYDTLTWGEGPEVLSQAGLQRWLWYELPTKYLTDEAGYQQRLAAIAAERFDELALDRYSAICRSDVTTRVHDAFERSGSAGYTAMRRAFDASGVEPLDTDTFAWSEVMGLEEAAARTAAEGALEAAIDGGTLAVGARGWRRAHAEVVCGVLDRDHPTLPGQSYRSAIVTERATRWSERLVSRSPSLAPILDRALKRSLVAPAVPATNDIAVALHPLLWLLERVGDGQVMTAAGYLNRPFVVDVWATRPWTDELLPLEKPPRSERDDFILIALRTFGEQAGLLRTTKRVLRRTKLGDRALREPAVAWRALVERLGGTGWERFVTEIAAAVLVAADEPIASTALTATVAHVAGDVGWRSDGDPPTDRTVAYAFADPRRLLVLFGMVADGGDLGSRTYQLTDLGERLATAIVHTVATGPRSRP